MTRKGYHRELRENIVLRSTYFTNLYSLYNPLTNIDRKATIMIAGQRSQFGKNWAEVVNNWCLGESLPMQDDKAWEALGVLEQLWPERLGEVLRTGKKGFFEMAYVINDGITLAACQNLEGFEGVLKRIKAGEQSALSELSIAAALVDLGYQPVLDTEHHGKRPDALISTENKEIFIDVITPEMSEDAKQAEGIASTLAQRLHLKLINQTTPSRLEVYILTPDLHIVADEIAHFLETPGLSLSETTHTLSDIALVKYSEPTALLNIGPTILVDTEFPIMGVARANSRGSSVTVRLPFTDDRLELLMSRKRKQFSKNEINLFVIDLSGVSHGFKRWLPLVRRRLQPSRNGKPAINTRFSGILLFNQYFDLDTKAFIKACHIEEHPTPYKSLPSSFLNDLRRFSAATT